MIHAASLKTVVMIQPTTIAGTAGQTSLLTNNQLDTLGFDYATILLSSTTTNSATNRPGILRLTESDTTVVTNFAGIVAFTGTTNTVTSATSGFVIPNMNTATGNQAYCEFNVDLRGRKRYLTLEVAVSTTQTLHAIALLSRAEQSPTTAAGKNLSGFTVSG